MGTLAAPVSWNDAGSCSADPVIDAGDPAAFPSLSLSRSLLERGRSFPFPVKEQLVNAPSSMTAAQRLTLMDCAYFTLYRECYYWKPATMRRLAALGLVEPCEGSQGLPCWRVSATGWQMLGREPPAAVR